MKDFNFDKMKNYTVPDELADKVLDTVANIKPSSGRYAKIVVSCICFTLVCAISIVVFGFKNQQPPTLRVSDTKETQTQSETETQVIETSEDNTTENSDSDVVIPDSTKEITDATQESESEQKSPSSSSPTNTTPGVKPSQKPSKPTTPPVVDPPKPTLPPEPSQEPPTTPPESPEEPSQEPPIEDPSDLLNGDCVVSFSPSYLVGSGKIYCRVKDSDKNTVGDKNLFSDQHLASFYSGFGSVYQYIYSPSAMGLVLEPGNYNYFFYNEHGVPILNVPIVVK